MTLNTLALKFPSRAADQVIAHAHLNLFVWPALPGRYRFFFEVGVHIERGPSLISDLVLVVPWNRVACESPRDLHCELRNDGNLKAIFKNAELKANIIEWTTAGEKNGGSHTVAATLAKVSVQHEEYGLDNEDATKHASAWRIQVSKDYADCDAVYFRIRFEVGKGQDIWQWRSGIGGKNGAFFDLRFQDARALAGAGESTSDLAPVRNCTFHLVLPRWLEPVMVSPDPKYLRLLEGHTWVEYIGKKAGVLNREKMTVYAWDKIDVGQNTPLRAFGTYRAHPGTPGRSFYVVSLVLVGVVSGASAYLVANYKGNLGLFFDDAVYGAIVALGGLGIMGVVSMLIRGIKTWKRAMAIRQRLKVGLMRVEDFLLRRPSR